MVSQLGRSFSWAPTHGASRRDLEVAVSVRGGRTRITITEGLGRLLGACYGGIGGGMGGGGMGPIMAIFAAGAHVEGAALVLVIPIWLGITFVTARSAFRRGATRREATLKELADRMESLIRDLVATPQALPRRDARRP